MRQALIVALLVGCLAPDAVAQTRPAVPRIGVLDWEAPDSDRLMAFRTALRELGHVDGSTIDVDYRYAEGRTDRADAMAAELVRRTVRVIVAFATPAAHAAKKATSSIPIVVATADPVGTGLVTNLARPGGNVTGISNGARPRVQAHRVVARHAAGAEAHRLPRLDPRSGGAELPA
ncbi:MAG TPA: ABC transporter substrate binding protein [Vineibacter sp.]|nr:ABC transporter substrate binding protein [Vineibacter sp.]